MAQPVGVSEADEPGEVDAGDAVDASQTRLRAIWRVAEVDGNRTRRVPEAGHWTTLASAASQAA
jgi:hypothetical protein